MWRLFAALLLGLWVNFAAAADGLVPLPELKARVTDLTATLSSEQRQQLESRLAEFETRKGSQIAVVLVPTFQPETIEQFSMRLAEAWKIGRKGVDDGVIVVVAKDDRALRIEVGYGLEGALNDATSKRIISEIMVPRLRQGDYFGALQAGIGAVITVIDGEALPPPPAVVAYQSGQDASVLGGFTEVHLLFALVALSVGGAVLRFFLGNLLGSGVVAGVSAVAGWMLLGTVVGVVIGLVAGFLLAMFGFDLLLSMILNRGGSGGGGSHGGGGSWGGGGGGFGGGGASGSW